MLTLKHSPSPIETRVHFGHELLYSQECLEILSEFKGQVVIISDSHLKPLLVDPWAIWLKSQGLSTLQLTFAAGEKSKNRRTKEELEDQLFACRCGKETLIIAVGGGVTTDLAGYLASTFCRGVPFIAIPTSLLAMVDAVIGGKTGVDTPFGKNLVGTFYPAQHILIDTVTLDSLPERQWRNGVAEVIKHGLIRSSTLFHAMASGYPLWQKRDPDFIRKVIYDSIQIKKEIVEADFQETGARRMLNFGHTVAHAIELIENYQIGHGEAVAIGMLSEAMLSHRLGALSIEAWREIERLLKLYQFPFAVSNSATPETLRAAMTLDKKSKGAKPRFVILEEIGSTASFEGAYCTEVDESLLHEVLTWTLAYCRGRS